MFASDMGAPLRRCTVRAGWRRVCAAAGIGEFQLRETRHTFVSVVSDSGAPIEAIADVVGHINSRVPATVYRQIIADTVTTAARAWDAIAE